MNDDFRYQCRRRPTPLRPSASWPVAEGVELVGAGSGGEETVYGSQTTHFQGKWLTCAGTIALYAEDRTPGGSQLTEGAPLAVICAMDENDGGRTCIRGNQGVRISSGPPSEPHVDSESISGIEMQAGDEQSINIMRGMDPNVRDELICLDKGNIFIHEGSGSIHISALQSIDISAGAGASSISLTPTGIVLRGPLIQIN
jgi:hypothetical protein